MKLFKLLFFILGIYLFNNSINAQDQQLYLIKSPENDLVMEVDDIKMNQDGVKVYLNNKNDKDTQKWIIKENGNGISSIVNFANRKAMSILSYDQKKDGNPLILVTKKSSDFQKWNIHHDFVTEEVKIFNYRNNKLLVPDGNSYSSANRIILNSEDYGKKHYWILVPVRDDKY